MNKGNYECDWCRTSDELLQETEDMFGNKIRICVKCSKAFKDGKCRKCGKRVLPESTINGICINCMQAEAYEKAKRLDEVKLGLIGEHTETPYDGLTDDEYEAWMNFGPKLFNPDMLKKSLMLRQLWAIIKLRVAGVYEEAEVNALLPSAMYILESNFSDIIGRKSKFMVVRDEEGMSELKNSEIIASKDGLFLVKA